MARTETICVQAHPEKVNEVIRDYEAFGWSVIGNQQITEDKGIDRMGWRHTSTYTKITLSRDADIKRKERLVILQDKYEHAKSVALRYQGRLDTASPEYHNKSTSKLVLCSLIAFLGLLLQAELGGSWGVILAIPLPISILYKVYCVKKGKEYKEERMEKERMLADALKKMTEAKEEARNLLAE